MSIQAQMKEYPYYKYDEGRNSYGEMIPSLIPIGSIKMAINIINQATNNYIQYSEADYLGLTKDAVDDTYIIQFENEKLKVKYVNPIGRLKQVALVRI